MLLELLKTVLLGIVQGITEWLPISSTGHMILVDEFVKLRVSDAFMEMFRVVIQFGSILAVLVLFFEKLNPFSGKKSPQAKRGTWSLWAKVVVAVLPSAVAGLLLDDWFETNFYNYTTVAFALVLYGAAFLIVERMRQNQPIRVETTEAISYRTALLIGLFQILALVPGTSRSGSTILGAMLLGLSRTAAAEFSFFLAKTDRLC